MRFCVEILQSLRTRAVTRGIPTIGLPSRLSSRVTTREGGERDDDPQSWRGDAERADFQARLALTPSQGRSWLSCARCRGRPANLVPITLGPTARCGSRRRGRCGSARSPSAGSILRRRLATWVRRVGVSSLQAGPQTSVSSARWVISRPRLRTRARSSWNSVGVRWISSPSRRDRARGEVDRRARRSRPSAPPPRRAPAAAPPAAARPARVGRTAWSRSRRRRPRARAPSPPPRPPRRAR